jgi:NADH:ubiquinone oxidoreductase subunit E
MECKCSQTDNWPEIEARSKAALPEHVVAFIKECQRGDHPKSNLISVLHKVQAHFGYLSEDALNAVAQLLQVPLADVTGAASFYHFFRTEQRGKYVISVCMGTACYVKGADRVSEKLKEELGVNFGETTRDGLFTLEASRCLGTCGLAPVMTVGDKVHPQVTPDKIPAILASYMTKK